jgi:ATP-dependent Lon protease
MLEKNIASIIRKKVKYIVDKQEYNRTINAEDLFKTLGPPRFQKEKGISNKVAGVVTGLAWTAVGGEILFVEVSLSRGKGNLALTGNLGDVMKESATIAFEYLKSHASFLGIDPMVFKNWNVHIHVPEGATPKDGPSAGITMFTALASAFTQRKIRKNVAMTGEITLRGKVLPVGGVKEKILAAKRAKVKDVILSIENKKDVEDIKENYREGLNFHYVDQMIEVTDIALLKEKVEHAVAID